MKKQISFNESCYQLLKRIPAGKVTTYQEIAQALGTRAYRAVGNAMNKNPNAPEVPCHRVVRSDGTLGGYAFGVEKKRKILAREGVRIVGDSVDDFSSRLFRFRK